MITRNGFGIQTTGVFYDKCPVCGGWFQIQRNKILASCSEGHQTVGAAYPERKVKSTMPRKPGKFTEADQRELEQLLAGVKS